MIKAWLGVAGVSAFGVLTNRLIAPAHARTKKAMERSLSAADAKAAVMKTVRNGLNFGPMLVVTALTTLPPGKGKNGSNKMKLNAPIMIPMARINSEAPDSRPRGVCNSNASTGSPPAI